MRKRGWNRRKRHELHNLSIRISACTSKNEGVEWQFAGWMIRWSGRPTCEKEAWQRPGQGSGISACSYSVCYISACSIRPCLIMFNTFVFNAFDFSLIGAILFFSCLDIVEKKRLAVECRFIGRKRYGMSRRRRIIRACKKGGKEWQLAWVICTRGIPFCERLRISVCSKSGEWQFAWVIRWRGNPFGERDSISACSKIREWHFALGLRFYAISACGSWQWPSRGIRIGEAEHPGPPHVPRVVLSPTPVAGRVQPADELDLDLDPFFCITSTSST